MSWKPKCKWRIQFAAGSNGSSGGAIVVLLEEILEELRGVLFWVPGVLAVLGCVLEPGLRVGPLETLDRRHQVTMTAVDCRRGHRE